MDNFIILFNNKKLYNRAKELEYDNIILANDMVSESFFDSLSNTYDLIVIMNYGDNQIYHPNNKYIYNYELLLEYKTIEEAIIHFPTYFELVIKLCNLEILSMDNRCSNCFKLISYSYNYCPYCGMKNGKQFEEDDNDIIELYGPPPFYFK